MLSDSNDPNLVVSVNWLRDRLENPRSGDPPITVFDCRFTLTEPDLGYQQYVAGHIPGAYYLDLNRDLSGAVGKHGGRHPLPDAALLTAKLSALGVTSNPPTLVVAYDDSRFAFASRLWWVLAAYLSHPTVCVLDGGYNAWTSAGYPSSTDIPPPRSGNFRPQVRHDRVADRQLVLDRKDLPEVVLVDAREGERYRGEREPIDPIAGHIPGAVNYPWQAVSDARGFLKSPEEQRAHWEAIAPEWETIVYCGSGVTACVNLLSLHMAGRDKTKLYAGSWSDWISYPVG